MRLDITPHPLATEDDWSGLERTIGGEPGQRAVAELIAHLRRLGAKSYLLEKPYIDRDYSAEYQTFYAQTFKTYARHCRRIHFFRDDIRSIHAMADWVKRADELERTRHRSYLGFSVLRPLPRAPLGRTVLMPHVSVPGVEAVITARAKFRANLLGAELEVTGAPFVQQDQRVGACAQAAIWMGARHMHARHGYDHFTVAEITRYAAPTGAEESASLPAGSEFLMSDAITRAIREMGYQPLCFEKSSDIARSVLPYVESGLPVIIGVELPASGLGHAFTAIGRVFAPSTAGHGDPKAFVPALVVHDDQAGPYLFMPLTKTSAKDKRLDQSRLVKRRVKGKMRVLTVEEHAVLAVVLMPMKVFSKAEGAELQTRRKLDDFLERLPETERYLAANDPELKQRLRDLKKASRRGKIVLRTYLTSAARYRKYIAYGSACQQLKDELLQFHLPHFVWVTEIATVESYNNLSPGLRRIYGHTVIDATASREDKAGLLMAHFPGILVKRDVNADPTKGEKAEEAVPIVGDRLYECREKRLSG